MKKKTVAGGPMRVSTVLWQWRVQFIVVLVSCGLLGAIFGVLRQNNTKRTDYWSLSGMSLNAFVATLAAVLRAMILGIVEEALSQHKWIWQLSPRPLRHLSHIDQASRGLWGSILLPARLRAWFSYSYIGCFLVLLSISVGPFAQQAVGTEICSQAIPNVQAKLPYNYAGFPVSRVGPGSYITEPGFSSAVIGASTGAANVNPSTLLEGCTTGNCTFPKIIRNVSLSTMGVCSKCIDTTHFIRKWTVNESTTVGLKSVSNFSITSNAMINFFSKQQANLEWAKADFGEEFGSILSAAVSNHTFLATTSDGCEYANDTGPISCASRSSSDILVDLSGWEEYANVFSASCSFYWCMRHHKVEVDLNTLSETLVAESPGFFTESSMNLYRNVSFWKPTCEVGDETLDLTRAITIGSSQESFRVQLDGPGTEERDIPESANCRVKVSSIGRAALESVLKVLDGTCIYRGSVPLDTLQRRWENNDCDPWSLTGLLNGGRMSFSSTVDTMAKVSTAITNRMREIAMQRNFDFNEVSPGEQGGYIYGDVVETAVCTVFLWRWLLGPALILLVTFVFLLYSVVRSVVRRNIEPLWKSSLLPALYLNPGSQSLASEHNCKDLERRADNDVVTLTKTSESTWELLKEGDESGSLSDGSQRDIDEEVVLNWEEH